MLKPRNPDTPPRGMEWIWKCSSDNHEIRHIHRDECRKQARAYCIRNNYPIGSNWEAEFDDNICQNTPGENCISTEPPTLAERLVKFSQAMAQWAKSGFPMAAPEEVERRKGICETCVHYAGSSSLLKVSCAKCGCTGLRLFMETEKCPAQKW